jgi:REP-associated tyrosine transposase
LAHTYVQAVMHVVFSTKERRKLIAKQKQPSVWAYLAGICQRYGILVHEIGGMEDHVDMLIQLPPTIALSDAVAEFKQGSSKWMGSRFSWQRGFGAFSVSASNLNKVIRYIRDQEAHHRGMSFDEEYLALLKKHGVAFDPNRVFG